MQMSGFSGCRRRATRCSGWRRWWISSYSGPHARPRSAAATGRRAAYDPVLMLRILVLQTLYTLSDDQTEY
jgi:hypothetical protein